MSNQLFQSSLCWMKHRARVKVQKYIRHEKLPLFPFQGSKSNIFSMRTISCVHVSVHELRDTQWEEGDGNDTPRLTSKGQLNSFVICSDSFLKEARGASFNQVT